MCLDLGNSIQNLFKSDEYLFMHDRQTTKIISMIESCIAGSSWAFLFSSFLLFSGWELSVSTFLFREVENHCK